ncbi:hypothetical protein AcV5_009955 [Taiwanofungus camphoratus]|nr:hypothetical protein AcV5_009955 [Antrodia cinnamomea]
MEIGHGDAPPLPVRADPGTSIMCGSVRDFHGTMSIRLRFRRLLMTSRLIEDSKEAKHLALGLCTRASSFDQNVAITGNGWSSRCMCMLCPPPPPMDTTSAS